ncbi:hypothetical protein EN745_31125 [Mesorhizobium sp. M4A.F.Ca.ET.022.05.2.1]|uniref:hypothetical protein n=1 Tax=Mesorhizobium sp. M4A.F.Ca.ET.022.05.2.1 TaxID=2496653 RepID=UPI000FC9E561|nr:hypothetical protein [Mesorhizobium sp. M4A.F.Ca.ET.022.05.2.1]RVC74054.1 hypothetical protein EN745_31125 [Mesorhizobium sp. M4A.F.Ca.ET.022.05.2.1]
MATILAAPVQKAPLLNAALAGAPPAPTPGGSHNSTRIATTGFVQQAIALFKAAASTFTARLSFVGGATGNSAMANAAGNLGEVMLQGNGTGAAIMALHRPSAYAA